jgi:hypothetical protein
VTTMLTELYDALREAGASEEKSRRAAEALANYDDRFNRIETRITEARADLDLQISAVRSDVTLLKWMTGTTLALVLASAIKLFVHG